MVAAMRTLVVSDLHLGSRTGADVLRQPAARNALMRELALSDRLVLLGDVLELRHGPVAGALEVALPILQELASALPDDAEVILVPGNHDHDLVRPWLDGRTASIALDEQVKPATASPLARKLAAAFSPRKVTVSYPGVWLREDVYAFHGHYLDIHTRVPTFERLAAGAMVRLSGGLPDGQLEPDDYERLLAPMYAWIHSSAQRVREGELGAGAGSSGKAYEALTSDGRRPIRMRVLLAALPFGVRGLKMLGLGDLSSDISAAGLLGGSLDAVGESVQRLGISAEHVIFGHSHRAGPIRSDDMLQWRTHSGVWLHNSGCWVHEPGFTGASNGKHPYWPGGAIRIDGDRPPQLLKLLRSVKLDAKPSRG